MSFNPFGNRGVDTSQEAFREIRRERRRRETKRSQEEARKKVRQDVVSQVEEAGVSINPQEDIRIVETDGGITARLTDSAKDTLADDTIEEIESEAGSTGLLTGFEENSTARVVARDITKQLSTQEGAIELSDALEAEGLTWDDFRSAGFEPSWFIKNVSVDSVREAGLQEIELPFRVGLANEEITQAEKIRQNDPSEFVQKLDPDRIENFDGAINSALDSRAEIRNRQADLEDEVENRIASQSDALSIDDVSAEVTPGQRTPEIDINQDAINEYQRQQRQQQLQRVATRFDEQTDADIGAEDVVVNDNTARLSSDRQLELLDQRTDVDLTADDLVSGGSGTRLADSALASEIAAGNEQLSPEEVVVQDGELDRTATQQRAIASNLEGELGIDLSSDDIVVNGGSISLSADLRDDIAGVEAGDEPIDPGVAAVAPQLIDDLDEQTQQDLSAEDIDIGLSDGEVTGRLSERAQRGELLLQADGQSVDPQNLEFEQTDDGMALNVEGEDVTPIDFQDQGEVDVSDIYGRGSVGTIPADADTSVGSGGLPIISDIGNAAGQVGSVITEPFEEEGPEQYDFENPADAFNARESALPDLEEQVTSQTGEDIRLDQEDIQIIEGDGGEPVATLSDEGEKTLAEQTAPLADVPIAGAFTSTGAGLRQDELEATSPIAESFDEATPDRNDVFGALDGVIGSSGVGVGLTGVGSALGQQSATGTGISAVGSVSSSTAGGVGIAAAPVALTTAGFASGDVDRSQFETQLSSELIVSDGTQPNELEAGGEIDQSEVAIGEPISQEELSQPERIEPGQQEVSVPTGSVFSSEIAVSDATGEQVGEQSQQPVADASPVTQGQLRIEEEEIERSVITGRDIAERPEIDQPSPSVRERINRDDLFVRDREFPTGESAVVRESTPTEDVEERVQESQEPFERADDLAVEDALLSEGTADFVGISGDLADDVQQDPTVSVRTDVTDREEPGIRPATEPTLNIDTQPVQDQALDIGVQATADLQTTPAEEFVSPTETTPEFQNSPSDAFATPTEVVETSFESPSNRLPFLDGPEPDEDDDPFPDLVGEERRFIRELPDPTEDFVGGL